MGYDWNRYIKNNKFIKFFYINERYKASYCWPISFIDVKNNLISLFNDSSYFKNIIDIVIQNTFFFFVLFNIIFIIKESIYILFITNVFFNTHIMNSTLISNFIVFLIFFDSYFLLIILLFAFQNINWLIGLNIFIYILLYDL